MKNSRYGIVGLGGVLGALASMFSMGFAALAPPPRPKVIEKEPEEHHRRSPRRERFSGVDGRPRWSRKLNGVI